MGVNVVRIIQHTVDIFYSIFWFLDSHQKIQKFFEN